MICVFFVPGMFGSTIEYVLNNFTKERKPIEATILPDGSMHSFKKQVHLTNIAHTELFFKNSVSDEIVTPIYPFKETHLSDILTFFNKNRSKNDSCILVHSRNIQDVELNLLFQYHKIATGSLAIGLDIFCGQNQHNITQWNKNYQHWSEMEHWQLREWFSLFYVAWAQEWISSADQVDNQFYKITNSEILNNPGLAFTKLIDFCQLTCQGNLQDFSQQWLDKQLYILNEFNLLEQIVTNTIDNIKFNWRPINIVAEAVVQQRLRTKNYEIRCDGLNIFPTDSETLYKLLEKCYT